MSSQSTEPGTYSRDPVSELLDHGARQLLDRAYKTPGHWVSTRLADPTREHARYFSGLGIDVNGPDPVGRKLNTHTRWARGFVRAIYYQHQWYSELGTRGWRGQRRLTERTSGAIQVDVGQHRPELGIIPAGRVVSVILHPGGQAARRAVDRAPDDSRIFTRAGEPGGAASNATRRDW
jgi:hypothetical protein